MSWVGLSSFPEFVVVFWIAGFCHVLRWSVVISLVCGHFLARGLWSWPGWVCGHFLRLWFISWIVFCGHVMGGSVVIFWVCGHFLDRGQWSSLGWACAHPLGLWSFPGSGSMVMSWVCGHFPDRGLWSSLGWVCGHLLALWSCRIVGCGHVLGVSVVISWVCLWSSAGPVVISCLLVCGHVLGVSVVVSWIVVCGHVLVGSVLVVYGHLLGLWSSLGLHVLWVFMSSGFSCLLGLHVFWVFVSWVCIFMSWVGLRSSSGSALIIWIVVCSMSWGFLWSCPVCGHLLGL